MAVYPPLERDQRRTLGNNGVFTGTQNQDAKPFAFRDRRKVPPVGLLPRRTKRAWVAGTAIKWCCCALEGNKSLGETSRLRRK